MKSSFRGEPTRLFDFLGVFVPVRLAGFPEVVASFVLASTHEVVKSPETDTTF